MNKISKATSVLIAGTCINLTIGVLYAWSVFSKALIANWGWSNTEASMAYNVAIVVWAAALLCAGVMQDCIGPKKVITIGVVLVGLGMILSSFVPQDFHLGLILTFGVVVGAGIGFAYACVTPAAMKWYHSSKKGMVSGITVGGFGVAAVFYAPLCTAMIKHFGISQSFMIIGFAVLVIALPLTRLIVNPPEGYVPEAPTKVASASSPKSSGLEMSWKQMMGTYQFYFLWIMFVFSSSAGVMIIGNLASIATDQAGIVNPAYLVSILAISNATGRIGGGMLSDNIGRSNTMLIAFAVQAINMLAFASYGDATMIFVGTVVAGMAYGSLMSVFPSATADFYGLKNYGGNYGVMYTAWGVSGFVGPMLAGLAKDMTGSYSYAYLISAVLLFIAIVLRLMTKPVKAKL